LADSLVEGRRDRILDRVDELLNWAPLRELLGSLHGSATGAPGYPGLVMFKCLLLGVWHNLSDPLLEAAIEDRISFRRFVGLSIQDKTPDHSTIWRFREALNKLGLIETLFGEVNRQLAEKKLIVKEGTLIDASLVAARANPASKSEADEVVKPSADPDANWGRKGNTSTFGYKMHIGVDLTHTLIRSAVLGKASENDTERGDELIKGDEKAVYADMAYSTHARRRKLKEHRIKARIMHRPNKHHPELTARLRRLNGLISRVRASVERPFAVLKTHYGFTRLRFFNLARNQTHFLIGCCAYNLRRAAMI